MTRRVRIREDAFDRVVDFVTSEQVLFVSSYTYIEALMTYLVPSIAELRLTSLRALHEQYQLPLSVVLGSDALRVLCFMYVIATR